MFCPNCGKEIPSDKKYCVFCGAENEIYSSSLTPKSSNAATSYGINSAMISKGSSSPFNHDVLINYLDNLRTLEFAKHTLTEKKQNIDYNISNLGRKRDIGKRLTDVSGSVGVIIFMAILFAVALIVNVLINSHPDNFLIHVLQAFDGFLLPISYIVMIGSAIIAVFMIFGTISEAKDNASQYKNDIISENNRISYETNEKNKLLMISPHINKDLSDTEKLLESAYSVNIIPTKCRNIYGIYFLYDYISSSGVSLSEALFHFDLDEISRKLDVIINQQQQMIMELARSNAMNEKIIRQNEELLQHAIQTERNTALSAQYSQIAAVNSQTVAQIQSYYFFKMGL